MSCRSTTWAPWLGASRASSRIASMLALSALVACSSNPPKDQPPMPAPLPPAPVLPQPKSVDLAPVYWQVLTVDGEPRFALTAEGYEALSKNTAELLRWIKEASWQLDFYRRNRQSATVEGAK